MSDPFLERFLAFPLPGERIATTLAPLEQRNLLYLSREKGTLVPMPMKDLPLLVQPGDLWVVNISQVLPALSFLTRQGKERRVECLWLRAREGGLWEVWLKGRGITPGEILTGEGGMVIKVLEKRERGFVVAPGCDPLLWLKEHGAPPLPPYIRKQRRRLGLPEIMPQDRRDYANPQGMIEGSIAASTAAFHITPEMRRAMEARGAKVGEVILHIGPSTFAEVIPEEGEEHQPFSPPTLTPEYAEIPPRTFELISETMARSGRIVAVGTTVVRTLEGLLKDLHTLPSPGAVDLFITPGYRFRWVHALLTNFHLPHTTLRLLVAAFAGAELALRAYETAVAHPAFRFYSYGDGMFIA